MVRLVLWLNVVVAAGSFGGFGTDVAVLIDRSRSGEALVGIVIISVVSLVVTLVAAGIAWKCKRWLDGVVVE